jgi:hypothetical protein
LADAGLVDVEIESIGDCVLPKWVPEFALPHLDYIVVVATAPVRDRTRLASVHHLASSLAARPKFEFPARVKL